MIMMTKKYHWFLAEKNQYGSRSVRFSTLNAVIFKFLSFSNYSDYYYIIARHRKVIRFYDPPAHLSRCRCRRCQSPRFIEQKEKNNRRKIPKIEDVPNHSIEKFLNGITIKINFRYEKKSKKQKMSYSTTHANQQQSQQRLLKLLKCI